MTGKKEGVERKVKVRGVAKSEKETTLTEVYEEVRRRCIDILTDQRTEMIYVFDGAIWRPNGKGFVKKIVEEMLGDRFTTQKLNNALSSIQAKTYRETKEPDPNMICLINGVFDINTKELKEHSPDYFFLNQIPVYYRPQCECPKIKDFLWEIMNFDDIEVVQEYVGYCLYRSYPFAKAWVGIGEGENGKSTFLEVVRKFLGKENVATRSLQDLADNRFAGYDLKGKLADIYPDLSDKALIDTGKFKMLTGYDMISIEQKFRDPTQLLNYAKLMFSCNWLPDTRDNSSAFFRRWILCNFPNSFSGEKAKKRDDLIKELTSIEEMAGFLNWTLEGLDHLLKRGYFINSKTADELREDYLRKASTVKAFVMDCLEQKGEGVIAKKELYNRYCEYCRIMNYPPRSEETFHENLRQVIRVEEVRPKMVRSYQGIIYSEKGLDLLKTGKIPRPTGQKILDIEQASNQT